MDYRSTWNLATIPYPELSGEWNRRRVLQRKTFGGGRPKRQLTCAFCGQTHSAVELSNHIAGCRKSELTKLISQRTVPVSIGGRVAKLKLLSWNRQTLLFQGTLAGTQHHLQIPIRSVLGIDRSQTDLTPLARLVISRKLKPKWLNPLQPFLQFVMRIPSGQTQQT